MPRITGPLHVTDAERKIIKGVLDAVRKTPGYIAGSGIIPTLTGQRTLHEIPDGPELARVVLTSADFKDDVLYGTRVYGKDSGTLGAISAEGVIPETDIIKYGGGITIYKPFHLRASPFDVATVADGELYKERREGPTAASYSLWTHAFERDGDGFVLRRTRNRDSTDTYVSEVISPSYSKNDQLIVCRMPHTAMAVTKKGGGDPKTAWLDLNVDARRWVQKMGEVFVVDVTQTGGSAGDAETKCDWTYAVEDVHGNSLGSHSPSVQRPTVGAMIKGDGLVGTGYFDPVYRSPSSANDSFHLLSAGEQPDPEVC